MIQEAIRKLTEYGIVTGLLEESDRIYTSNRLLELFDLDGPEEGEAEENKNDINVSVKTEDLEGILAEMLDYAWEKGLMPENDITHRDLFDTKIMGLLTPRPSEVIGKFHALYEKSPRQATDFYYKFSQDTDYIRRYRIARDRKWTVDTEYGRLDITINLSKPEKDPKAIAAARAAKQGGYPKCLLCRENVGYR